MTEETQTLAIIDFGSQYTRLVARRARELGVHSLIFPPTVSAETLDTVNPIGLILSGGPASVFAEKAPQGNIGWLRTNRPVLGICYGSQWLVHVLGGNIERADHREYGSASLSIKQADSLFLSLHKNQQVWLCHADKITSLPKRFTVLGETQNCACAAFGDLSQRIFGIQFHPEVKHTTEGIAILRHFLYDICGAKGDWTLKAYAERSIRDLREKIGDKSVILGLSGGVDSMVTATLLTKAVGDRLTCIFVNTGLMRRDETVRVANKCHSLGMNLKVVDASEKFLSALKGIVDPEQKRKTIGRIFIEVFEGEAKRLPNVAFLGQGTLYPDVIESVVVADGSQAITKSHHNVGGLPERLGLTLVEPLRDLFKDEARALGLELGLSEDDIWRQPFPGPGLAVRIIGEITKERLEILRSADVIVLEEIHAAGWYRKVWQSFAILLPISTARVVDNARTFGQVIALRIVESSDGMTADWSAVPDDLLRRISSRITSEVSGVNRVVLDITSKPPATIEWE